MHSREAPGARPCFSRRVRPVALLFFGISIPGVAAPQAVPFRQARRGQPRQSPAVKGGRGTAPFLWSRGAILCARTVSARGPPPLRGDAVGTRGDGGGTRTRSGDAAGGVVLLAGAGRGPPALIEAPGPS